MEDLKPWFTSRTIWTNLIVFLISVLAAIFGSVAGFNLNDPVVVTSVITGALSGVNMILRLVTKTGLSG